MFFLFELNKRIYIILAICWTSRVNEKPLFVLVKGCLQGTGNKISPKNFPPICQFKFLETFIKIYQKLEDNSLNLSLYEAKCLANEYNSTANQFYKTFNGWIRTDQIKYYKFKVENKS